MTIFTILFLSIHEHGRFFHLPRSSISFFRDLKLLSYRSFTCLAIITSRYFILFVTIVKGVFPNFFLSMFILWVEEGYWFVLILYSATLLKLFIRFKSSRVVCWGSLKNIFISSANSNIFISSSPIYISLTSFCCQIDLARTSITIFNW